MAKQKKEATQEASSSEKGFTFSKRTIEILKNFADINPGVYFRVGSVLRTVTGLKHIFVKAQLEESFPKDFGIGDLSNFLGVVSLYSEDPVIFFGATDLTISGYKGRSKISYRYTVPHLITLPPEGKEITVDNWDVTLKLSEDDLKWIQKSAGVLSSPDIVFESDGKKIYITTVDLKKNDSNTNSLEVGDGNGDTYKLILKTENLKVLPGDYLVNLSSRNIAQFCGLDIEYFLALEAGSVYQRKA